MRSAGAAGCEASAAKRSPLLLTTVKAVAKNPLIIATVLGHVFNVAGFRLPDPVRHFLSGLGGASLAMGLLCIGAGLRFESLRESRVLLAAGAFQRLMVLPAIAAASTAFFGLTGAAAGVVLIFAMLPTAQSCYEMTAAMRGDAPAVAGATTLQTLAAMATIPFWIAFAIL